MNTSAATNDGLHNPDINRRPDVNNPNAQNPDSGFNGANQPAAPMHQQPGMNSQHNPAYGSPDTGTMHEPGMNIPVSGSQSVPQHEGYSPSSGSGANDMVSPIGTHSSGEPAAMHQQPGMHQGPGPVHSAGTAHMPGNDPALGAQQPHAHGVPHVGGADHYDTEKQTVNTSRATGGGERLGNKIKSAAAQGQVRSHHPTKISIDQRILDSN